MKRNLFRVYTTITTKRSLREWIQHQQKIINLLIKAYDIRKSILWHFKPVALRFTDNLNPLATLYNCIDAFCKFKGAADVEFTEESSLGKEKQPIMEISMPYRAALN